MAILLAVTPGCTRWTDDDNSAGAVAARYVAAVSRGDATDALACVAPNDRARAEPVVRLAAELASAALKPEGGLDSVTVVDTVREGDRVRVELRVRTKQGRVRSNRASAVSVAGVWYVAQ